jgi:DNA (cytosine-5)-methyltransferase 1
MKYISVCSGIEAATVAWHPLGWEPVAFSEIEVFPSAVLAHHYPNVPNVGDMTAVDWREHRDAARLVVGGTPCQAFSVAGLRKGLDDPRGNLTLHFLSILERVRPEWVVWENVPGVLSIDGGRTFGTFLGGLGQLGYGFAYRVLDAQFCGVPQRRRRVFVVGHLGDWRRAAAVLFERHSLSGNTPPRREKGERVAGSTARCVAIRGRDGDTVAELGDEVQNCMSTGGGGGNKPHALVPVCFDTTQVTSSANYSNPKPGDPCHPLAAGAHAPAVAYRTSGNCGAWDTGDRVDALTTGTDPNSHILTIGIDEEQNAIEDGFGCLKSREKGGGFEGSVMTGSAVRRLTPRECERLQGFFDDYTYIPMNKKGKMAKDGPRYKALGNSMAVPVMRWIGERIQMVENV